MGQDQATIKRQFDVESLTIATGQTKSGALPTMGFVMFGMELPSNFDGTAMTFEVASTGDGTYQPLYESDGVTQAAMASLAPSRSYDLPSALAAWPFFKLVAGTAQATTDTVIKIVKKG